MSKSIVSVVFRYALPDFFHIQITGLSECMVNNLLSKQDLVNNSSGYRLVLIEQIQLYSVNSISQRKKFFIKYNSGRVTVADLLTWLIPKLRLKLNLCTEPWRPL